MISVIPGMIENVLGPNRDLQHKERDSCLNIARELKSNYNGACPVMLLPHFVSLAGDSPRAQRKI